MALRQSTMENAYSDAVALVLQQSYNLPAAVAEIRGGINKRTLAGRVNSVRHAIPKEAGRRTAISSAQEQQIAQLCLHHASGGKPILKEELACFVQEKFGSAFSHVLKNGRPGKHWIKRCCKSNDLSFSKPNDRQEKAMPAQNADVLTSRVASPSSILNNLNLGSMLKLRSLWVSDVEGLFCLDETGMNSGKECHGRSRKKAFMCSWLRSDRRSVAFENNPYRVT